MEVILVLGALVWAAVWIVTKGVREYQAKWEAEIRSQCEPPVALLTAAWRAGYNRAKFQSTHPKESVEIERMVKHGQSLQRVTDYIDQLRVPHPSWGQYSGDIRYALLQYAKDLQLLSDKASWQKAETEAWKGDIAV